MSSLFLDRALQKDLGFVGTESRLRLVISTLGRPGGGASDDPEVRLRHLREERARIDAEIARVERDGVAARYEPAAVRERFATAVTLLKQLMADFRAVEDRFRKSPRTCSGGKAMARIRGAVFWSMPWTPRTS